MIAPSPYRVKGTGNVRQIYDGDRWVGTIICGLDTWTGWRPDGTLVRGTDDKPVRSTTIARWRTPNLWRTP